MTDYFKNYWRNVQKKIRQNLPIHYRELAAQQIIQQIKHLPLFYSAKIIALYHAINGEIDLQSFWELAEQKNIICVFPCLTPEKTLRFLPASSNSPLENNQFGIPEPQLPASLYIPVAKIDIMFVPLVAFDIFGNRIGMGGGYYDRTLAKEKPKRLIGVGYDFQRTSLIIPDPWDIPMQEIVTPQHIY